MTDKTTTPSPLLVVGLDRKVIPLKLRPMHERPPAGSRITVYCKDGDRLDGCIATMVYVNDRSGIVIYYKRHAVDEMKTKGWMLDRYNADVTGLAPEKGNK